MSQVSEEKRAALAWIDAQAERLSRFGQQIWNYAEPAFREYKSAKAYCALLRSEGFEVEEGSGDMPTAFAATYGSGKPVLGSYAEYDAVPENSQQPVPYRAPREGLHPWAPGHTDPHSALGVAALTGTLAAKAAMERHGLGGTLRFFGEPAEKVCASKPAHAAKGYYDGADAYLAYHPSPFNTTMWDALRIVLERAVCVRVSESRSLDQPVAAAVSRVRPRCRTLPGGARCGVPDVHNRQIPEGGDVPPHRNLDAQ